MFFFLNLVFSGSCYLCYLASLYFGNLESSILLSTSLFRVLIPSQQPNFIIFYRCEMKYLLLEMDRIIRPEGYVIIRESNYFLDAISTIAKGMRWDCSKHSTEYNIEKEKLLICQKKLWHAKHRRQWEREFWSWLVEVLKIELNCTGYIQYIKFSLWYSRWSGLYSLRQSWESRCIWS